MNDWLNNASKAAKTWTMAETLITGITMILVIFGVVAYAIYLAVTMK